MTATQSWNSPSVETLLSFIQLMVQYNPMSLSYGNSAYRIISQILVCQILTCESPWHLSQLKTILTLGPSSNLSRSTCILSICLKLLQACCKTTILTFMRLFHHQNYFKKQWKKKTKPRRDHSLPLTYTFGLTANTDNYFWRHLSNSCTLQDNHQLFNVASDNFSRLQGNHLECIKYNF